MKKTPRRPIDSSTAGEHPETGRAVLSNEEIGYLRSLFGSDDLDGGETLEIGLLPANAVLMEFLPSLAGLRASAEDGHYRYDFPLELVSSSDLKLRIQSPRIYDTRGASRCWRAAAHKDGLTVEEESGRIKHPRVENLSSSGVFLTADSDVPAPLFKGATVRLAIGFPDLENLDVLGKVVRFAVDEPNHRQLLAIEFINLDEEAEETICAYLLRVHCVQSGLASLR